MKAFSQHAPKNPKNDINTMITPIARIAKEAVLRLICARSVAALKSLFHLTNRTPMKTTALPNIF